MSCRQDIRDKAAAAALCVAKIMGTQVTITFRGGTSVTVWAIVLPGEQEISAHESNTNTTSIALEVPRQTNFPPTRFSPQGYVTLNNVRYGIERAVFTNEDISMTPTITLECMRQGEDQMIDG